MWSGYAQTESHVTITCTVSKATHSSLGVGRWGEDIVYSHEGASVLADVAPTPVTVAGADGGVDAVADVLSCVVDGLGNVVKAHGEVEDHHHYPSQHCQDVVDDSEDVAAERVVPTVLGIAKLPRSVVVHSLLSEYIFQL